MAQVVMILITTATLVGAGQKLPFPAGETWWVSQGNQSNSKDDTHRTGSTMEFAWDFNYPGGADLGRPVLTPSSGKVAKIYRNAGGWGNVVIVDYENGDYGKFAHLQDILVEEGQRVSLTSTLAPPATFQVAVFRK
ncbi:MAG: M23 family metallopeptidase [Candidatus Kerfeldbacteria bacterium]|nr:M23 family metallopeptidase [Candidatus Kerfeldbacteria bacterium]